MKWKLISDPVYKGKISSHEIFHVKTQPSCQFHVKKFFGIYFLHDSSLNMTSFKMSSHNFRWISSEIIHICKFFTWRYICLIWTRKTNYHYILHIEWIQLKCRKNTFSDFSQIWNYHDLVNIQGDILCTVKADVDYFRMWTFSRFGY